MKQWKRIVIKVGTSTLCHPGYRLNIRRIEKFVKVLSDLQNASYEILLVSSGAIAMGVGKLGLPKRPEDLASKQACAAVGQCELMYIYDKLFSEYNHTVSQILLTSEDLDEPTRRNNIKNTITQLLEFHTIPVLNENDTVATHEITSIGDNDTLAAEVSVTVGADLLILLSDIDGLFTADPHKNPDATIVHLVEAITPEIVALAGGSNSEQGTGGMATKVHAAEICMNANVDMVITNGKDPDILYNILDGKEVGTLFGRKNV